MVIHPQLLLTAAHVLFWDASKLDEEEAVELRAVHAEAEAQAQHKAAKAAASASPAQGRAAQAAVKAAADAVVAKFAPLKVAAGAAMRVDPRHSGDSVPFAFIRVVFVEPIMQNGRVIGRTQHIMECHSPPLRYSDSMDAAVLRIKAPLPGVRLVPLRLSPASEVQPRCSVALITFKSPLAYTPHEIPGNVLYVEERTKKHGSGGHFTIGETDYLVQGGFSGGAVVRLAADGVWELVGVHTGTDFTRYGDTPVRAEQSRKRKGVASSHPSNAAAAAASSGSASATPRRSSHSASSSRATDGTVSCDPSDTEEPVEVPAEESGDALQHAQTHSARATFFVAECVLTREHWRIPYMLTLPAPPAGALPPDSSPPRGQHGGTSARSRKQCIAIAEETCGSDTEQ